MEYTVIEWHLFDLSKKEAIRQGPSAKYGFLLFCAPVSKRPSFLSFPVCPLLFLLLLTRLTCHPGEASDEEERGGGGASLSPFSLPPPEMSEYVPPSPIQKETGRKREKKGGGGGRKGWPFFFSPRKVGWV